MRVVKFTLNSPPSDEQFAQIADGLLASLSAWSGIEFEATETNVETNAWVTMNIRSKPIHLHLVNLVFVGILSYSLREGAPSIQSILLPFSHGKRFGIGRENILFSEFLGDETGGAWSDFKWGRDEYGEWDCDDLPPP